MAARNGTSVQNIVHSATDSKSSGTGNLVHYIT